MNVQTTKQTLVIDFYKVVLFISSVVIVGDLLNCYIIPSINRHFPNTFYWFMSGKIDRSTFLLGMWAVQATIGAITIAILTLLAGVIKDRIYGVPFLAYLTDNSPKSRFYLNIWEETVIVIVITGFEYIPIAKLMVVTSTIMFIVAFTLILDILYRILSVLVFQEYVEESVKNMLLTSVLASINKENGRESSDEVHE